MTRAGAVTALSVVALIWSLVLLWAPSAVATGGAAGGTWASLVYHAAGRICHQFPTRSFLWDGVPFPVCGRCLALYLSGTVGLVAAAGAVWGRPHLVAWPRRPLWTHPAWTVEATWLAAATGPSALLLAGEWSLGDPGTVARALAALPLGALVGWICGRALGRPAGA